MLNIAEHFISMQQTKGIKFGVMDSKPKWLPTSSQVEETLVERPTQLQWESTEVNLVTWVMDDRE